MSLEQYRNEILSLFGNRDKVANSLGKYEKPDIEHLQDLVLKWWECYKEWERKDTLEAAFKEQRLTVKGTSSMDMPIQAMKAQEFGTDTAYSHKWSDSKTFEKPKNGKGIAAKFEPTVHYPIKKTNQSIVERLNPANFVPEKGESRKTEMGLHDLSAGLMNPKQPISKQQYKSPGNAQTYVFMPLSKSEDQAVFQNINVLAKSYRTDFPKFYTLVRNIRSKMTRIKLAAEHDMATNYVLTGHTQVGRPKFKFTLMKNTDVSANDVKKDLIPKETNFEGKKVIQIKTTPEILQARQVAALNFQSLVLGEMLRYGEVTIAYREHAGIFPIFARFDKKMGNWGIGLIGKTGWTGFRKPVEEFKDFPKD